MDKILFTELNNLLCSGEFEKALEAAGKAKKIFSIYYGPDNPDSKEVDEMVEAINSLTKLDR